MNVVEKSCLIRVADLSVKLKKGTRKEVLKGINLDINENQIIAIVGETGSGKTTLIKAIMRLLPSDDWQLLGSIKINEENILEMSQRDIASKGVRGNFISAIFSETANSVNPCMKIGKQLDECIYIGESKDDELYRRKEYLLRSLDLTRNIDEERTFYNKYPFQLSTGERQRFACCLSLINNCRVLLADEPTSSLDAVIIPKLINIIREKMNNKEIGSFLFVTHDINFIKEINADYVGVIKDGKMIEFDSTAEVLINAKTKEGQELFKKYNELYRNKIYTIKRDNKSILNMRGLDYFYLKKYPWQSKQVLFNISFNIKRNEFLGLAGDSGSGKTTLIKAILGTEGRVSGEIFYDNIDLKNNRLADNSKRNKKRLGGKRREIQYIPQDVENAFDPSSTIRSMITQLLKGYGVKKQYVVKMIKKYLEKFNLSEDILDKYPNSISSGEKQRLSIIRALLLQPRMVIADEPLTHLDFGMRAIIVEELKKHIETYGTLRNYILISHDMKILAAMCERVDVIENGMIKESIYRKRDYRRKSTFYGKELIKINCSVSEQCGPKWTKS